MAEESFLLICLSILGLVLAWVGVGELGFSPQRILARQRSAGVTAVNFMAILAQA
jgi:hypothetical protein